MLITIKVSGLLRFAKYAFVSAHELPVYQGAEVWKVVVHLGSFDPRTEPTHFYWNVDLSILLLATSGIFPEMCSIWSLQFKNPK